MIGPWNLYVAYSATSVEKRISVQGWMVLRETRPPNSVNEIEEVCRKIAEVENIEHVIPLWWTEIKGDQK